MYSHLGSIWFCSFGLTVIWRDDTVSFYLQTAHCGILLKSWSPQSFTWIMRWYIFILAIHFQAFCASSFASSLSTLFCANYNVWCFSIHSDGRILFFKAREFPFKLRGVHGSCSPKIPMISSLFFGSNEPVWGTEIEMASFLCCCQCHKGIKVCVLHSHCKISVSWLSGLLWK